MFHAVSKRQRFQVISIPLLDRYLITHALLTSQRVAEPVELRYRIGRHRASRHTRDSGRASYIPDRTRAGSSLTLPPMEGQSPEVLVDAIFSAHSDGLMVVLRRSENA